MADVFARRAYPSDLSDEQWAIVERELPPAPGGGRTRTVNLREIVNAIFYRLRTGCSWEMLPHDLPPKSTVFEYCAGWRKNGTWERLRDASATRRQEAERSTGNGLGGDRGQPIRENHGDSGRTRLRCRKATEAADRLGRKKAAGGSFEKGTQTAHSGRYAGTADRGGHHGRQRSRS